MSQNPLEGPFFSHRGHLGTLSFSRKVRIESLSADDYTEQRPIVNTLLQMKESCALLKHTRGSDLHKRCGQSPIKLSACTHAWAKVLTLNLLPPFNSTYLLMRDGVKRDNSLWRWISALPLHIHSLLCAHIVWNCSSGFAILRLFVSQLMGWLCMMFLLHCRTAPAQACWRQTGSCVICLSQLCIERPFPFFFFLFWPHTAHLDRKVPSDFRIRRLQLSYSEKCKIVRNS